MENYCIPPSAAWYAPSVCTPNNGLLYIAGNQSAIAYVPPISSQPSEVPSNRIIHLNHHVKSIVCDPNWSSSKWFVTLSDHNVISVWNLETENICRGHKAHHHQQQHDTGPSSMANNSNGGAMCITKDRHVLSIDRNAFVNYCIVSNTYTLFSEHFIPKPNTVCTLKSSPYDADILAVGYRNGLISIVNLKQTTILQRLRAHDTEIISLEWMRITADDAQPIEIPVEPRADAGTKSLPAKRAQSHSKPSMPRRDAPQPIVDEGDMFDIHSFDYLEEEFGSVSKPVVHSHDVEDSTIDEGSIVGVGKGVVTNENFNYVEACESLRDQIIGDRDEAEQESLPDVECSAVNMSDIKRVVPDEIADGSIVFSDSEIGEHAEEDATKASNQSTFGSSHDANEFAEIENELSELKISVEESGKVYLASGAQESFVIIWDVSNGNISDKLQLKVQHGKMAIPKPICAVAWYKPRELIVNSLNGKISKWSILSDAESKIHKSIELKEEFIEKSIIGICSNANLDGDDKYVWTFSMHLQIIGRKFTGDTSEIVANIATLPIGMLAIRECPHDPNRIAIAGNNKRINILDLATFRANNVQMQSLTSKIQGKVLALAWHPANESQIAFSTNEGRVGVFDISKTTSPPEIMMNFCGKNVYNISFGIVNEKSTLFACNGNKLMMFRSKNAKQSTDHAFKAFAHDTSAVSANDKYVAVGLANGALKIFDSQLSEIWSNKLAKKYISSLAWSTVNPLRLAVSSMEDKIHIIEIGCDDVAELIGHQSGVAWVKWSNQLATKLVSAGFDGAVRVWDTEKKECIAWHRYENRMFTAIFLPTDENFVLCSGKSETAHIFDVRQHLVDNVGEFKAKNKKKPSQGEIQWAELHQTDVPMMKEREKKRLRKLEKQMAQAATTATEGDDVEAITHALNDVALESSYKLNFTTIFHLTNKELNKEPLKCLERLLTGNADVHDGDANDDQGDILHTKLFSTRDDVQKLLETELQNHKASKTESIGNLIIPQINHHLKENIVGSITVKKLTQQQIALAPAISYEFWRNCCIAYASQCFDEGLVLQGLPYLLAIHQTTEIIERLCEVHFYREAWVVAKMYKEAEEKSVFESIATKWITHLEQMGSLDSAAMIAYMAKQPAMSLAILNRRKNQTPQIENVVKLLQEHIEGHQVHIKE